MAHRTETLTAERLRELLIYDPETGIFTNRVTRNPRAKVGAIVGGFLTSTGYRATQIDGMKHGLHRLAWLYVHGVWPEHEIDHRNRVRHDNRLVNLRLATRLQNSHNCGPHAKSISGVKGVAWVAKRRKWQVQMRVKGQTHYIGTFATVDDALRARKAAEQRLYVY